MRQSEPGAQTDRALDASVTLYYDLYVPPGVPRPRPLLVALHGYGDNKEWMMRAARLVAPEGFAVASLQGPYQHIKEPREPGGPLRYGFGWLTNFRPEESIALHHRALLDLTLTLARDSVADRARVFLLGFSQSCALNYRFAFTHADALRGVVGVCGGLPGDWETSALYKQTDAAVFHLYGERDEFYPPSRVRDYAERLRTRARDVRLRAYDAAHELAPAMLSDVREWLAALAG